MRRFLDGLYSAAEWLAMAALAAIALLVLIQVLGRVTDTLLTSLGFSPFGLLVPSLAEFAGFLLVGASFLALAGALRAGVHIRVTLAIGRLPQAVRRPVEIAVLATAAVVSVYFTYYAVLLAVDSYRFGEVSYGIIPVPLWIPQSAMAGGIGIFALALLDDLVVALRGGTPSYLQQETQEPLPESA